MRYRIYYYCLAAGLLLTGCHVFSSGEIDSVCGDDPKQCPGASDTGDTGFHETRPSASVPAELSAWPAR